MKFRKILFPTDFSHTGDAAMAVATALARDSEAELLIVHVEEAPPTYEGALYYGMVMPDTAAQQQMLDSVRPTDTRVACRRFLLEGPPAQALVQFAAEEGVDLIVMGTHGRTGLSRLLMGSVAEEVIRHSKVPVLSLRHDAQMLVEDESPAD
ncbi:universal stress protein [Lignipirellula cremea]|uniref:Universal stress protein n=1 Tax=Lignipirellula cremea TaxID=2528010 RepID=A0A518DP12_9BACT|nr:universal stress protein [Lignipirellula cremea]QDU93577.1 Putative universal stress protein [Lignipirellula cremea]